MKGDSDEICGTDPNRAAFHGRATSLIDSVDIDFTHDGRDPIAPRRQRSGRR
jgi:hypothetical protein